MMSVWATDFQEIVLLFNYLNLFYLTQNYLSNYWLTIYLHKTSILSIKDSLD